MGLFGLTETRKHAPGTAQPLSVLGAGIEVLGSIHATGTVRIDGVVRGDVRGAGEIVLGPGGEVDGDIAGDRVTVGGQLRGGVVASASLVLSASAVVEGDVSTPLLTVEEGAVVNGRLTMADEIQALEIARSLETAPEANIAA